MQKKSHDIKHHHLGYAVYVEEIYKVQACEIDCLHNLAGSPTVSWVSVTTIAIPRPSLELIKGANMRVWGSSWQAHHSLRDILKVNLQTLLPKSHRMKAKIYSIVHPCTLTRIIARPCDLTWIFNMLTRLFVRPSVVTLWR